MRHVTKIQLALSARRKAFNPTGANPKHKTVMPGSQNRKKGYGRRKKI